MSYILDALKKAETERNLGAIPTIHANPSIPALSTGGTSLWRKMGLWAILLFLVTIVLIVAWIKLARPNATMKAAASVPPIPPTVAQPKQIASNSSPAVKAPLPAAKKPVASVSHLAKEAAAPSNANIHEAATSHKSKSLPLDATTVASAAHTHKKTSASSAATAAEPPILAFQDLPPQIQKEIPFFNVSGYIYSNNQSDRSILIDNRLLREGDQIAPDLILEKMIPTGLVLNYRGYRYRKSY
jgi:general secretion pathway protein B